MSASSFLFSVDLEDIRQPVPRSDRLRDRVEETTQPYLEFLRRHQVRTTFFTTGDVARRYPALVKQVADEGYEIACHSDLHVPLDRQDPESLVTLDAPIIPFAEYVSHVLDRDPGHG